jgi:DMSO/TMAO reductase YedYZ molybdopterin-dependent catalytic subunit
MGPADAAAGDLVALKPAPFNAESPLHQLAHAVTPTPHFYVRSNFAVPQLNAETFRLSVGGTVEHELSLSLADLRALGTETVTTVMECAGNNRLALAPLPSGEPWQAGAVSAATWTGVPLGAVLDRAGVREQTVEILFRGADRGTPKDGPANIPFARSLPLEKARAAGTLLAWGMNGGPLPAAHGAPLRLVVPGWYGMASVKWVERLDAIDAPFDGYYQANRYIYDLDDGARPRPVTAMRVKSLIVFPSPGAVIPEGPITVQGKAWSGGGDIVRVEVAIDGGEEWHEARLLDEPSPDTWRPWEFEWRAAPAGRHVLRVRATDNGGHRQPHAAQWNKYGYGNNAVQTTMVDVVADRGRPEQG